MSYYNLDPATFMNLNPSLDCNNLQVGQQVCVSTGVWTTAPPTAAPTVWTTLAPTAAPTVWTTLAPTAAPTVWTTVAPYISSCAYPYVVKSGDTCWGIANQVSNIGDAAFIAANPGINCGALQVGQIVCLGGGCGARTYVVQPGDTCWSIWTKYGISEASFYSMNPSLNCGALKVGDVVTVGRTC
jgi:LysM repeat protein